MIKTSSWKSFGYKMKYQKSIIRRSMYLPSFSYCPTILYFGTQENIDKLQLLQNRCLRIILKCDRYTSISNMRECLGLMNVKHFLFLQTMCFVHKLVEHCKNVNI